MRIGIDLTALWRPATGMENLALEMAQALLRIDSKNQYTLFFCGAVHPAFEQFDGRYIPVLAPVAHEALLKNLWFPPMASAAKLDYLHFPVFPPPLWSTSVKGWTVHDATPWMFPDTMNFTSRWYFRILSRQAARSSRVMFTVTESARDDIVRHLHIPIERLHVIYPGVRPIFQVSRDLAAFERVRQRYGLPEKFILFVGTLQPRKNLRRLLQALRVLRIERGFQPALAIVGRKGWLCDSILSELADESLEKSVIVTGYVPDSDLVVLYNMAHLLAFPSLYEGFGLPCIEAMACGCPLVTSNRGALREVGGDSALYADPEDVRAIAQAVWEASENQPLREQLIDRGLRRVGAFSWDRHAEQLLGTLERVVFGSNGSQA